MACSFKAFAVGTAGTAGVRRAASFAVVLLTAVVLAGGLSACSAELLDPKGPIGAANRTILLGSLAIMLAIVVPTIIATLAFAWWYRASNTRARYLPDWSFSGQIELVVWSIPTLVILLLGGVTCIGSHQLDPYRPIESDVPALEIQVVSLDWKWLFIYPGQGIATVNQMVVPVGVPLHFKLTSASVMNAFFIPQLGSMIYTMNGMTTQLHLRADEAGTYRGMSSHYSGDGFADMRFDVRAVSADEFASWAGQQRSAGPALNAKAYAALAVQSMDVRPAVYGSIDPQLFDAVVMQQLPPGPGPATEDSGDSRQQPTPAPDQKPVPGGHAKKMGH